MGYDCRCLGSSVARHPSPPETPPTDLMTRPLVFLDLDCEGEGLGRVTVELFTDTAPRTAENFRALCTGVCSVLIRILL